MEIKAARKQVNISFDKWCEIRGNQALLADYCGVTPQAVGQWRSRMPAVRVLQIERFSEGLVTRHELRPDLYPVESEIDTSGEAAA